MPSDTNTAFTRMVKKMSSKFDNFVSEKIYFLFPPLLGTTNNLFLLSSAINQKKSLAKICINDLGGKFGPYSVLYLVATEAI